MGFGLYFECKLYGSFDDIKVTVVVEVVYKVRSKDATGVVYVSFPELRWVGIGSKCSVFYIFHYEVSYNY